MTAMIQSGATIHASNCVVFGFRDQQLHVLLTAPSQTRKWQLPGAENTGNRSLEETAIQCVGGLSSPPPYLRQVATYSQPNRLPGKREIATTFLVLPPHKQLMKMEHHGRWFALDQLPSLAFDHEKMLKDARSRLTEIAGASLIVFQMLPELFTLSEVQQLQEELIGRELHRPNFRRTLAGYDFLVKTPQKRSGVRGGPALYKVTQGRMR